MIADTNHAGADTFTAAIRHVWSRLVRDHRFIRGILSAGALVVLLGALFAVLSRTFCEGPNGNVCPAVPAGPDGTLVNDRFFFVHQPLIGDGSLTARVTSLSGIITYPPPNHDAIVAGVVPWAKVGLLLKDGTRPGAPYAAVLVSGSHGVRMQSNFVADTAGTSSGASPEAPRWLRLTRAGDTIAGHESTDGIQWTLIGTARLDKLPRTTQVGLFATSPCDLTINQGLRGGAACRFTQATGSFDQVEIQGESGGGWQQTDVGAEPGLPQHLYGNLVAAGEQFVVTGAGDIGPLGTEGGSRRTLASALVGLPVGMLVVMLVAARLGATYRARMRLGPRMFLAHMAVLGAITLAVGLIAAVIAAALSSWIWRASGTTVLSAPWSTAMRVVVGSALVFALAAIFALGLGTILGRARVAASAAATAVVLPQVLATLPLLSDGLARWVLRVTPAAGFAILQSVPQYPQVLERYAPAAGYFPLAPWTGLAVLVAYTALAMSVALFRLCQPAASVVAARPMAVGPAVDALGRDRGKE